jgi:hypothetical protein
MIEQNLSKKPSGFLVRFWLPPLGIERFFMSRQARKRRSFAVPKSSTWRSNFVKIGSADRTKTRQGFLTSRTPKTSKN